MIEPLDDGGIAHYAFNLTEFLASKKIEVLLFTSRNFEFKGKNTSFEVFPHMFKMANKLISAFPWLSRETKYPSLLRRVLKLLEYPLNTVESLFLSGKRRTEIVHFQTVNLTELIMIIAFKCIGKKVVFTIHNVRPRHESLRFHHRMLYRLMYSLCDHLIIHAESGKEEVVDLFGVRPGKISVIPHGDYKFFLPPETRTIEEGKETLGIPKDWKTVLFFGAIRPNKGLDNMLLAMPRIRGKIPRIKLLIVGEPCESYRRYREIVEKEKIEDNVFEKLEYVPNNAVSQYFFASDLVVLPYNEITQSGVLQIAYAFGKPVVATAVGGFNEAIDEGKNGFLVPPHDIEALADRIAEVLQSKEKMEKMGKHSRYLSDTKYSWDSIAAQTLKVYSHLLP